MTAAMGERAGGRSLYATELQDAWPALSPGGRLEGLRRLPHADAEDLLRGLPARDQAELVLSMAGDERRSWIRLLAPDDTADLVQAAPEGEREHLLGLLDEPTRKDVVA